ncbi:MAG: thiamine pyrophosphate-dependent enzyme, partial [Cyanobacteria bacterium P01_A01_bin.80]
LSSEKQNLGGFQDAGVTGSRDRELFEQAVFYSEEVNSPQMLPEQLQIVFNRMTQPQRGPTHLILSLDTQSNPMKDIDTIESQSKLVISKVISNKQLTSFKSQIKTVIESIGNIFTHHHRIVFLVGSQLLSSNSQDLQHFAKTFRVPIMTTAATKGLLPETDECSLGNSGFGGNNRATTALLRDDLTVLVLMGLNEIEQHQFSLHPQYFPSHRQLIWINQSKHKSKLLPIAEEYIVSDCTQVIPAIIATIVSDSQSNSLQTNNLQNKWLKHNTNRQQWLSQLTLTPQPWSDLVSNCIQENTDINHRIPLNKVIQTLQVILPKDTILCADSGATRLAATQNWIAHQPHSFLSAPHGAPMGWAIAAGIGAQMAQPGRSIVVLTGDGSMRMHGMEITTAARYKLPILFIVCNNQAYGSLYSRQYQDKLVASHSRLPELDWVGFANSLGVRGIQVTNCEQLVTVLQKKVLPNLKNSCQPFLIEIMTPIIYKNPAPITGQLC